MTMLALHILIALTSLGVTTWLFIAPSTAKLQASYGLAGATIVSGTFLVLSSSAHILQTCMTGLLYLGTVTVGIVLARQKLAKSKSKN